MKKKLYTNSLLQITKSILFILLFCYSFNVYWFNESIVQSQHVEKVCNKQSKSTYIKRKNWIVKVKCKNKELLSYINEIIYEFQERHKWLLKNYENKLIENKYNDLKLLDVITESSLIINKYITLKDKIEDKK